MWAILLPIIIATVVIHAKPLERIVGGKEVTINEYPYQLSIRKNSKHICGGALIGAQYGLSAAHCFKSPGSYSVRAGSALKDSGGVIVNINTVYLHPKRTKNVLQYDIAILKFQKPLTFNDVIRPVKLPDNDNLLESGINGVISGYGKVHNDDKMGSAVLRAAQISVQNSNACQDSYKMFRIKITRLEFCASYPEQHGDSCQGDSGGPFVIENTLYGLVSFGLDCGDPDHPGIYTSVAAYREFIKLNTGI